MRTQRAPVITEEFRTSVVEAESHIALLVGHGNLMSAGTGAYASEAGSGVFAPRAGRESGFELVALLAPDDWMRLAELMGEGSLWGRIGDFGGAVPSQQLGAAQERSSGDRSLPDRGRRSSILSPAHPLLIPGQRPVPQHLSKPQPLRLTSVEDRLNDVWREAGERQEPADIGVRDALLLCKVGDRSGLPSLDPPQP
jgi:hypothetical protein